MWRGYVFFLDSSLQGRNEWLLACLDRCLHEWFLGVCKTSSLFPRGCPLHGVPSLSDDDREAIDPLAAGAPDTADVVAVRRDESVSKVAMSAALYCHAK